MLSIASTAFHRIASVLLSQPSYRLLFVLCPLAQKTVRTRLQAHSLILSPWLYRVRTPLLPPMLALKTDQRPPLLT